MWIHTGRLQGYSISKTTAIILNPYSGSDCGSISCISYIIQQYMVLFFFAAPPFALNLIQQTMILMKKMYINTEQNK